MRFTNIWQVSACSPALSLPRRHTALIIKADKNKGPMPPHQPLSLYCVRISSGRVMELLHQAPPKVVRRLWRPHIPMNRQRIPQYICSNSLFFMNYKVMDASAISIRCHSTICNNADLHLLKTAQEKLPFTLEFLRIMIL